MPPRSRAACTLLKRSALFLSNMLLAASVAAQSPKQSPDWPVHRLHAPSSSLLRLSQADQAIAIKLLRPELGPLFQGDASSMLDQQIRSFRAERINLGGVPAVALSPSSGDLCGSKGNCSFWIIDLSHRRIVLRSEGVQAFAIDTASAHSTSAIVTSTRNSASESEMTRWHFGAAHYERESCATLTSADDTGAALNSPKITPHPCSEGN
jgi:hypothetical protein